jgi:hypothetical protein
VREGTRVNSYDITILLFREVLWKTIWIIDYKIELKTSIENKRIFSVLDLAIFVNIMNFHFINQADFAEVELDIGWVTNES